MAFNEAFTRANYGSVPTTNYQALDHETSAQRSKRMLEEVIATACTTLCLAHRLPPRWTVQAHRGRD
jgi:hypothetical protein